MRGPWFAMCPNRRLAHGTETTLLAEVLAPTGAGSFVGSSTKCDDPTVARHGEFGHSLNHLIGRNAEHAGSRDSLEAKLVSERTSRMRSGMSEARSAANSSTEIR